MLLQRVRAPARVILSASQNLSSSITPSNLALQALRILNTSSSNYLRNKVQVRRATHAAQGRANGAKDGAGKRLGAKKTGEQLVVPGNIIFRQRGTHWFPGENCDMGRDHTIFATAKGYVKYYRDPLKHPKRRYIGVAFERDQVLPTPPNAARRRRLGFMAVKMKRDGFGEYDELNTEIGSDVLAMPTRGEGERASGLSKDKAVSKLGNVRQKSKNPRGALPQEELKMQPGYMYREANWQIGLAAQRAGIKVKEFVPGDRFMAWRRRSVRRAKTIEMKALRRKQIGGGKKKR